MSFSDLLTHYGVYGVFLGCLLEGETSAMAGGVLAHQKILVLWQVVIAAFLGSFLSDVGWFLVGRRFKSAPLNVRLGQRLKVDRVVERVKRNPYRTTLVFRFIPGMRIVGPLVIAQTRISTLTHMSITSCCGMVWALFFTLAGHVVSQVFKVVLGEGHHREVEIILGVLVLMAVAVVVLRYRRKSVS